MSQFPIYCETGQAWLGIAEPLNFATNAFILVAAALAAKEVRRYSLTADAKAPWGPWLLVALLAATGVGSFLWHGWRTALTLMLDTYSGLLFLIALVWVWAGTLWGRRAGFLAVFGLIAGGIASLTLSFFLMMRAPAPLRPLMLTPFFLIVVGLGLAFVRASARHGADAARFGLAAIGCGILAAIARSADLPLCPWVPRGTHFLWHGFLSLAAYLSIVMLCRLKAALKKR